MGLTTHLLKEIHENANETKTGVKKIVCVRSQHSVGKWPNCGPDTYVAVQVVPAGIQPLINLDARVAKKRGITIHYFGEGYQKNTGPKSALGRALQAAEEFAESDKETI